MIISVVFGVVLFIILMLIIKKWCFEKNERKKSQEIMLELGKKQFIN